MSDNATWRQHYVAQGYLRGFSDRTQPSRNMIWVYNKGPTCAPFLRSVRSVAFKEFYYAQEDDQGNQAPDLLEKGFSEIEDRIAKIISSIPSIPGSKHVLPEEDLGYLAFFVALSLTRVPSFRDPVNAMYKWAAERVFDMVVERQRESGEVPREVIELLDTGGIEVIVKPYVSIPHLVQGARQISLSLLRKTYEFFVPTRGMTFISSDNPVFFVLSKQYGEMPAGPASPLVEVAMPLRRDLAIVFTPLPSYTPSDREAVRGVIFSMTAKDTKRFNKDIAKAAKAYIFADHSSNSLARLVSNARGTEQTIRQN